MPRRLRKILFGLLRRRYGTAGLIPGGWPAWRSPISGRAWPCGSGIQAGRCVSLSSGSVTERRSCAAISRNEAIIRRFSGVPGWSPPPFSLPGRWLGRWNMCLGPERRLNGDSSASAPWILGRSGSSPEEKSTKRIAATPPAPSCLISIPWSGIRSCAGYLISPCQCCPRCAALMGNMDRQIWEDCWTIRCRSEVLSGTPMPPFLDTDAWSGGTAWRVTEQAPAY